MKNAFLTGVFFCAFIALLGCGTISPDWNGTWRLDASKSTYKGLILSISISADGEYRSDDGPVSNTFRCDGVYRSMGDDRTQACVKNKENSLDLIRMKNGAKINTYHWEISADGKTLTSTATAFRSSGPVVLGRLVAPRISGSTGFAGTWLDISRLHERDDMTITLDSQALHVIYPNTGENIDAPFNGTYVAISGPSAEEHSAYTALVTGRRSISLLSKYKNRSLDPYLFELSDDGKVITQSWRDTNQPSGKSTIVYEKE